LSSLRKRIFSNTLIYGIGDLITKGAAVFLVPLYTHLLTTEDYGIIASVGMFTGLLSSAMGLTLGAAVTKMHFDFYELKERKDFYGTIFLSSTAWALFVVVALVITSESTLNSLFRSVPANPYLKLGVWITFFSCLAQVPLALLQVQERPLAYRVFTLISFITTTLSIIWFVAIKKLGAVGSLRGQLLGAAIAFLAYSVFMLKNINFTIKPKLLAQALSFALPLVLYNLGSFILVCSGRYFLERQGSLGEVGLYNLAYQYSAILGMIVSAFNMAWAPIFYELAKCNDGPSRISRVAQFMIVFSILLGLALVLFSREVFYFMTPVQFHRATTVVPFLVFVNILTPVVWINLGHAIAAKNENKHLIWITLVACATVIGLSSLLVPEYGMIGAALATLFAYLIFNVLAFFVAQKCFLVDYHYVNLLSVLGLAAFFVVADGYLASLSVAVSIALRLLFVAIQFLATLVLFVNKDDILYFRSLIAGKARGSNESAGSS